MKFKQKLNLLIFLVKKIDKQGTWSPKGWGTMTWGYPNNKWHSWLGWLVNKVSREFLSFTLIWVFLQLIFREQDLAFNVTFILVNLVIFKTSIFNVECYLGMGIKSLNKVSRIFWMEWYENCSFWNLFKMFWERRNFPSFERFKEMFKVKKLCCFPFHQHLMSSICVFHSFSLVTFWFWPITHWI